MATVHREEGPVGFESVLADERTHALMRVIAQMADAKRYSFGQLARDWNRTIPKAKLSTTNIRRHFESQSRPSEKTVETYATILRISVEDLKVLAGEASLPRARVAVQIRKLKRLLSLVAPEYEATAIEAAHRLLDEADAEQLTSIATRHRRAELLGDDDMLATTYNGFVDFRSARRAVTKDEHVLCDLWMAVSVHFPQEDSSTFIALAVGLLRRRGVDTTAMEDQLSRQIQALPAPRIERM